MTISYTPLPPAPVPGAVDFEVRAGRFLDAMPKFGSEMAAIAEEVAASATLVDVDGNATIAATAASQAALSAAESSRQATESTKGAASAFSSAAAARRDANAASVSATQSGINALAASGSAQQADNAAQRAGSAAELADSQGNATAAQQARLGAEEARNRAIDAETAAQQDADATAADRVQTGLDAVATAADRIQTGLDAESTAADRVQTGLDAVATAADRIQTGLDRQQTGLDADATAADRLQTGLDRQAASGSASSASVLASAALARSDSAAASAVTATSQASLAAGYAASASSVVQQDLSGVNAAALHRSPNAVTAMFIYDTGKDSDGGAWTEKCQGTSWYNEPINGKWLGSVAGATLAACETAARAISGATTGDFYQANYDGKFYKLNATSGTTEIYRGNKRDFPRLSAIVAEPSNVTIYDLTEPGRPMWMRFNDGGTTGVIGWASSAIKNQQCVSALNGQLLTGSNDGGCLISFPKDDIKLLHSSGAYQLTSGRFVASRNNTTTYSSGDGFQISGGDIRAFALTFDKINTASSNGLITPLIAVGMRAYPPLNLIRPDGAVVVPSGYKLFDRSSPSQNSILN